MLPRSELIFAQSIPDQIVEASTSFSSFLSSLLRTFLFSFYAFNSNHPPYYLAKYPDSVERLSWKTCRYFPIHTFNISARRSRILKQTKAPLRIPSVVWNQQRNSSMRSGARNRGGRGSINPRVTRSIVSIGRVRASSSKVARERDPCPLDAILVRLSLVRITRGYFPTGFSRPTLFPASLSRSRHLSIGNRPASEKLSREISYSIIIGGRSGIFDKAIFQMVFYDAG